MRKCTKQSFVFFRNVFSLIFRVYTEIAIFGQYSARTASKSTFKNKNFFFFSCLYSKTSWFWLYKSQDKKNKSQRQRPRKTHHTFIPYHACSRTEPAAGGWILFSNQTVRSRFGARFVSIRSRSASFVETRLFSWARAITKVSEQKNFLKDCYGWEIHKPWQANKILMVK